MAIDGARLENNGQNMPAQTISNDGEKKSQFANILSETSNRNVEAGYGLSQDNLAEIYQAGKVELYDQTSIESSKTSVIPVVIAAAAAGFTTTDVAVVAGVGAYVAHKALDDSSAIPTEADSADVKNMGLLWDFLFGKKPTVVIKGDESDYEVGKKIGKDASKTGNPVRVYVDKDTDVEALNKGVNQGRKEAKEEKEQGE